MFNVWTYYKQSVILVEYIKKWLNDIRIKIHELIHFGLNLFDTFAAGHFDALNKFVDCSWATLMVYAFPLALITLIQASITVKYQLLNFMSLNEFAYFLLLCFTVIEAYPLLLMFPFLKTMSLLIIRFDSMNVT